MSKSQLVFSPAFLFVILFGVNCRAQAPAQTPPSRSDTSVKLESETKTNKEKVVKIGKGNDITIHRRSGQDLAGTIMEVKDESVVVREVDLRANVEINYQQIKSVEKGYTDARGWNGQRIPPKKHRTGLIIIGVGAAALAVFLISVLKNPKF